MRLSQLPKVFTREQHNWQDDAFQARHTTKKGNTETTIIVSWYDVGVYTLFLEDVDEMTGDIFTTRAMEGPEEKILNTIKGMVA